MTVKSSTIQHQRQRRLYLLATVAALLFIVHLYFVAGMVLTMSSREQILKQISQTESSIIALESEFISLSKNITLDLAHERGFVDAEKQSSFVYADDITVAMNSR